MWTILKGFGYEDLPERLNGVGIHNLDNVMTLDPSIHAWFDKLEIWFEAVVSGIKSSSPRTLNVRRRTKEIPIIFALRKKHTFTRATQTPSRSKLQKKVSRCRTLLILGSTLHVVELLTYLGLVNTWTTF